MPVDKDVLQRLIDEIPFTKAEDKTYFTNALLADESAATQFIGQRLRHADYTNKTTALATKEKDLATKANQSVQQYATQLAAAQDQQRKIMDDLANERISRTRAETLLQKVKTVYQLSDEDIPKIDVVDNRPKLGQEGLLDKAAVEQMMRDHEKRILEQLQPVTRFPEIPVIINEIQYEYSQLHPGERLSEKQIRELMVMSSQSGQNGSQPLSLMGAYEEKFDIANKRKAAERAAWDKENRAKWEAEETTKRSEEALRQVKRGPDGQFQSLSPVMGRKYGEHVDSTNKDDVAAREAASKSHQSGPKPSGAEIAAQKFIERRQAGIPMGQEAPTK